MAFVVSSSFVYMFWGCLGSTILPRREFELGPVMRSFKQRTRKKGRIMPQTVVAKPWHRHFFNFRVFVQIGICPCVHAVVFIGVHGWWGVTGHDAGACANVYTYA